VWVLDRRAPSAGQFAPFLDWMCASSLFSSFIRRLRLLFAARWSSCIVRTTGVQPRRRAATSAKYTMLHVSLLGLGEGALHRQKGGGPDPGFEDGGAF